MNPALRLAILSLVMVVQVAFSSSSMAQGGGSPFKRIWNRVTGQTQSPATAPQYAASPQYQAAASPQAVAPQGASAPQTTAASPQAGGDPYGFGAILNQYRASAGLPPLAYCPNLSALASQNNSEMCRKGLGHHVLANCFQNSGWNYADASSAAQGWIDSPAHRANMLAPNATRFGISHGPGPYWTLNAQ